MALSNPLIAKLEKRDRLSPEERRVLEAAPFVIKNVPAGEDIAEEGQTLDFSTMVLEGWTTRNKVLEDGRRQITAFHIAGDFVDLHSFLLKPMDHSVTAVTPCRLALVKHAVLTEITEKHPHLTRMLWLSTLIDAAIHREWLVALGRRSALSNLAHLLCELYLRLETVGLTKGGSFQFPVTQVLLADALGLSPVHVNRVLQELRREDFVTWRGANVVIKDFDKLKAVGEFDPTYLNLTPVPR